jgi:hypothetical protein
MAALALFDFDVVYPGPEPGRTSSATQTCPTKSPAAVSAVRNFSAVDHELNGWSGAAVTPPGRRHPVVRLRDGSAVGVE